MKTIGLIGGMSWESTKVYYQYLNQIIREKLGGSHSAKIMLSSVDFHQVERLSFEGNWEAIGRLMADHAQRLERAGADVILLCTNTIHLVADHIREATSVPFLHIATATGAAIEKEKLNKVGLLGTQFTMEKDFYSRILEKDYGLEVLTPKLEQREVLQTIIYDELVKGVFTEASNKACLAMIDALQEQGAEGIILGCTELPILVPPDTLQIPAFDTTRIHVEEAIKFALS